VKRDLIWESVVQQNAAERRGTHATKTRAMVSGSGKKPWRQKGTGRARVGEIRNPLWRGGGTVFGPQPRSYAFTAPKKVELGGLQAALAQKAQDGALVIVEKLEAAEKKTRATAALLKKLGSEMDLTLLIVEHHMGLVMKVCDQIVVLDFGSVIAAGTPAEIQKNDRVIEAYLGAAA